MLAQICSSLLIFMKQDFTIYVDSSTLLVWNYLRFGLNIKSCMLISVQV
jgi:hypothetical protein